MIKKEFKKECPKCGREHYNNRSCIKKEPESNNIYKLIKERKIYE